MPQFFLWEEKYILCNRFKDRLFFHFFFGIEVAQGNQRIAVDLENEAGSLKAFSQDF